MKRWAGGLPAAVLVFLASTVVLAAASWSTPPVSAQSEPAGANFGYDIKIEPDTRERASTTTLGVHHVVTLTDKATGALADKTFAVFNIATNLAGGEESPAFACTHAADNSLDIPSGIYDCSLYVDHGGDWIFTALIADLARPEVILARATRQFNLVTDEVYTGDPDKIVVKGSATEVAMLWGHGLSASAWFAGALIIAALVLPGFRRSLSRFSLYRIERRLDLIVKLTATATVLVTGTGTYLLLNQTAYETPFSSSAIDGVFLLPYGRPYFLALAFKLALYAVMVLGTFPLVRAAQRQLRLGANPSRPWPPRPAPEPAGAPIPSTVEGTLLTAPARAAVTARPVVGAEGEPTDALKPATPVVRVATLLVVAGLPVILFCVTLLKYFHELVEATRNLPS